MTSPQEAELIRIKLHALMQNLKISKHNFYHIDLLPLWNLLFQYSLDGGTILWNCTIDPAVKAFTKDIGIDIKEVTHSDSISDEGFGRGSKDTFQGDQQEGTPEVQSSDLVPVALDVKPLRSISTMETSFYLISL